MGHKKKAVSEQQRGVQAAAGRHVAKGRHKVPS